MFFGWAFLLYGALSKKQVPDTGAIWRVILAALVFGASTEIIQYFLPKRSADVLDLLADMLGAITGLALVFFIKKEINRKVKKID